jgi:hypothetical protein
MVEYPVSKYTDIDLIPIFSVYRYTEQSYPIGDLWQEALGIMQSGWRGDKVYPP